jgi:hypothetical protein
MLGTVWTELNEGNTVQELADAFGISAENVAGDRWVRTDSLPWVRPKNFRTMHTNLKLTGAPLAEYDWERLSQIVIGKVRP